MIQIIPAILSTSEEDYGRDVSRYNKSQSFRGGWVHIDFMDNIFVQNQSIKPSICAKYPINLRKEAHLMVLRPMDWIDNLLEAGFERVIIHIEAEDVEKTLNYLKEKGLETGLAIKNETPVEKLLPFIDKIDVLLVMTIVPGFQGQPFIPEALEKVRRIKSMKQAVKVGVDGHVNEKDAKQIASSGVDFMIVGSYLLKGNIDENLEKLKEGLPAGR